MTALPADDYLRLSVADRLKLAEEIWESIRAHPGELPVTDAQAAELDRRLDAHRADPSAAEDAQTVLDRIRKRK
ncbi:MAG: addiction module protein [Actinomycetota bacterium]